MATVTFKNVRKVYPGNVEAVKDFNLDIKDKEFVVFVGPSGCGKSTTLRMVAGLEEITAGEIYIDDVLVNNVEPKDRDISMVFQNYALYPHMTVFDNIAFPLKMRKFPKSEIKKRVEEAAKILEISELLGRKPKALSGGQRQRVAIGRAIVREPKVFLMDEPLSNLDAKLRNQMRSEIIKLRRRIDTTFIYVTHDQTEAMTLGDIIVVMNEGVIMQVGSPVEVFSRPKNKFVAGFIGMPQMNFIPGELRKTENGYAAFMEALGVTPEALGEKTTVSTDFNGTLYSTSGVHWLTPDEIDTYVSGEGVTVTVNDGQTESTHGLYVEENLIGKDKYTYFMGGNNPLYIIENPNAATDETLLVVRDSYADSLAPFLSQQYGTIYMIDLRYYRTPVADYAASIGADAILVNYSVENFQKDDNIIFMGQ